MSGDQTEAAMVNALKALALLQDAGMLPLLDGLARRIRTFACATPRGAPKDAGNRRAGMASKRLERRAAVLVV